VERGLYYFREYAKTASVIGQGAAKPCAMLVCKTCANVQLLDIAVLGLKEQDYKDKGCYWPLQS
jgi:hypothetical protein